MWIRKREPADAGLPTVPLELPSVVLRDAARRLRVAALVWITLWSIGLVMNNLVGPMISPDRPLDDAWPWPANPAAFACILVSIGLVLYTRRRSADSQRLLNLALGYELVLALAIGLVNQWTPNEYGLSWICVLIIVHPLLVPNTPGKTFVVSVAAASMDLVGLWASGLRGQTLPPAEVLLWTYLPNYICAVIAVVPARILTKLSHQAYAAEELGSYKLGELLGRGGMGEVYRAEHRMLARPAAIKLIRPEYVGTSATEQSRALRRFEREARVTAQMHSPHTIGIYDFGVADDGTFYYVMELLDGFDLDTFVRRFGPVRAARTVQLLEQVCDSLAEAHQSGLIHQDIKPANVYVCRYGLEVDFVKVLDFGLVRPAVTGTSALGQSAESLIGGTPAYMAPEQALRNHPIDARTDIYAVGCLGYWLLTGQLVFESDSYVEVIAQHAQAPVVPPSQRTEIEVPRALERVILACLEKDPGRRPQSAETLARTLSECGVERWSREMARSWWDAIAPKPVRRPVDALAQATR